MKKETKKDELIHIRFESSELINAKRSMLSLQMNLLKVAQSLQKYSLLRKEQYDKKSLLKKELKSLNIEIGTLQTTLPELKIPDIVKHPREKEKLTFNSEKEYESRDRTIEEQLADIQNRLKSL